MIPKRKLNPRIEIAAMVLHQKISILNVQAIPRNKLRGARFLPHFCNIRTRSSLSAPISFGQGCSRNEREFTWKAFRKTENAEGVNSRGSATSTSTVSGLRPACTSEKFHGKTKTCGNRCRFFHPQVPRTIFVAGKMLKFLQRLPCVVTILG